MIRAGPASDIDVALREYDAAAEINERIDGIVSVRVDEYTNHIVINECLIFRPSEVLFALDHCAYKDVLWNLPEDSPDDSEAAE